MQAEDADAIVAVWLAASEEAHRFVEPGFWRSRADDLRHTYLPAAETYVAETDGRVVGFASLVGDDLAALFVDPRGQCRGVGSALIEHVQTCRSRLSLAVYSDNHRARAFYERHGFRPVQERTDEVTGQPETAMTWERDAGPLPAG